jgi:hypothetical protein
MNTQNDFKNDPLRQYLNPGTIEKAPAGFSEKIMQMVRLEPKPAGIRDRHRKISTVPLVSVIVTAILAVTVIVLPASSFDFSWQPLTNIIRILSLQADHINFKALSGISLPGFLPYLFLSILFLTVFDRGLYNLFHRHK